MSHPSPQPIYGPPLPAHQMGPQMPQPTLHAQSHTPPFQPGSSVPHSPVNGHAALYYHGYHEPGAADFMLYQPQLGHQSPMHSMGSEGSSSSPPLSNHNQQSPPQGHYTHAGLQYIKPEPEPEPVTRVDSLNTFLQDVFPEVGGPVEPVVNRAMPAEEIAEMERNMKRADKEKRLREREHNRSFSFGRSRTGSSFLLRVRQNRTELTERCVCSVPLSPSLACRTYAN